MKWVEFVKKFAKDNNIKYGEALKKAKVAWKKHKEENNIKSKAKPKERSKPPKAPKQNMKMVVSKKASNLAEKLNRDYAQQQSLDKRKEMEDYIKLMGQRKKKTERVAEYTNLGMTAEDAEARASKEQLELESKIAQAKPLGGAFLDEKQLKGARKTIIARYKKFKKKVIDELDAGNPMPVDMETLKELAKNLAGTSKTNQYAKFLKSLEKRTTTKKHEKSVKRTFKKSSVKSNVQMKEESRQKNLAAKIAKDTGQQSARNYATAQRDLQTKRQEQLIRLGATPEEAQRIAEEESRGAKEQQEIIQRIQIAKVRKGMSSKLPTGGLSYSQFVSNLAKDKKVDYNTANTMAKQGNLFSKYQLTQISNLGAISGDTTALPILPSIALPQALIGRTKYVNKDGSLNRKYVNMIAKVDAQLSGKTSSAQLFASDLNTRGKISKMVVKLNELSQIPVIDEAARNDLLSYANLVNQYQATGYNDYKSSLSSAIAKTQTPPKPRGRPKKVVATPTSLSIPTPSPNPKTIKFIPSKQVKRGTTPTRWQSAKSTYTAQVNSTNVFDANNKGALLQDINDARSAQGLFDAFSSHRDGEGDAEKRAFFEKILDDLDDEIGTGAGFVGGHFDHYTIDDVEHDSGGALVDWAKDKIHKYKTALGRKLEQLPTTHGIAIRGIGKVLGRHARKQDKIDDENQVHFDAALDMWNDAEKRGNHYGFEHVLADSNDEHSVYLNEAIKKVILAYRGSANKEDWIVSDKAIAKGNFQQDERYKREAQWTKQMMAKYKGYKVELTGFSLGASLALHMAHVFKVPYVSFNAGVGADYKKLGKEMGQNEGKYYHTEGDAVSALGLGQFKDTIMIRNKTGNMASAHSRNSYTKYSYDKDQQQKSIEDEAREAQLKATPAQTPPVEPTKLTIPPPPSQNVQVDTATEPVFDRRDLDTLTDEWGGSIFDDLKKILPSTKNSTAENIDKKIKNTQSLIESYSNKYAKPNLDIEGGSVLKSYANYKDIHDRHLASIMSHLHLLQRHKAKEMDYHKANALQKKITKLGAETKYLKLNYAPKIDGLLRKGLTDRLDHDNLYLKDLGGGFVDDMRGYMRQAQSAKRTYDSYKYHSSNNRKATANDHNDNAHNILTHQLGKLFAWGGKKIFQKLTGGGLTSQDHKDIIQQTGLTAKQIVNHPHFNMVMPTFEGYKTNQATTGLGAGLDAAAEIAQAHQDDPNRHIQFQGQTMTPMEALQKLQLQNKMNKIAGGVASSGDLIKKEMSFGLGGGIVPQNNYILKTI